ncbi:MAG: hypothetical protein A2504_06630 [Bdellovibrionales bacterium RIFOXYD12_FULL_39_22]|nr:MAG: hypothetical protein A2385_08950 [Bdellovibrionales bacterium RIFOXYB1_FULL_39_21]OFZ45172.1 MAG: hypothetical protein A2485_05585 [Bdellovibrionales bacterium RIFOXYC12_FULL_39_17]OFZ45636.1 MAG: hypothetical protein A2404_03530 [Bdellovibrionales bacterium RIFOXYC1_FULL_39_130]OFZ74176.1 MAG: hypothetical protein A2451_05900 [Bdellovibrionales bacterium RIFOXYC2_FULL_39_8]OFZ77498.1 MAG: hypothetical protein A2560_09120 [Bdellovibrionales bacterium RIFOXYD1_FULL_39_84]OFZ91627.1 MAG:
MAIKKFATLLIACIMPFVGMGTAVDSIYTAEETLPSEFKLLLEAAQDLPRTDDQSMAIYQALATIDLFMASHLKEESSKIILVEIYKNLLSSQKKIVDVASYINEKRFTLLKHEIKKNAGQYSRFALWIALGIISDLHELFSVSLFESYIDNFNNPKFPKEAAFVEVKSKLRLIFPIVTALCDLRPEEFNEYSKKEAITILSSIARTMQIKAMLENTPLVVKEGAGLKFFHTAESSRPQASSSNGEDKIAAIISRMQTEEEETNNNASKAPRDNWIPAADPSYTPPAELPHAINDWFVLPDTKEALPAKKLPLAINDWFDMPQLMPGEIPPLALPEPVGQEWDKKVEAEEEENATKTSGSNSAENKEKGVPIPAPVESVDPDDFSIIN